jgi:hypothetical protein
MPEFDSLWTLFQYYDPDESGHLSREEFAEALESCRALIMEVGGTQPAGLEDEWDRAGGHVSGYLSFRQFVTWTSTCLGLEFPMGIETANNDEVRPCRFTYRTGDGARCSCPAFSPSDADGLLCTCGHKTSMHRSDAAQGGLSKFLSKATTSFVEEGLVQVNDDQLLQRLQDMMSCAHKTTHNWTRDRGCVLHGVNGCAPACSFKNPKPVPKGYKLEAAYRNQNTDLLQQYTLLKTAIAEECGRAGSATKHETRAVATSSRTLGDDELDAGSNEWYLWHGTSAEKCMSICCTNFKLNLAGSGATWKDPGKTKGVPLYGYGIYLAEHVTKADEYSSPVSEDDAIVPEEVEGNVYTVLLCRVMGGRTNVVTTNEIEVDKLRNDVFDGPYHSVFGDRVTSLNKPFREIVVYDKDQVYPEFLLVYSRVF